MRFPHPPAFWLPRRTVRLRLTLLYGGLFLVSGAALLALNYALVDHATQGVVSYRGDNGLSGSIDQLPGAPSGPDGNQSHSPRPKRRRS